jgi:hypothetical protein
VSFTLVRLRDGSVLAGFHELNHADRVLDIDETVHDAGVGRGGHVGSDPSTLGGAGVASAKRTAIRLTVRGTAQGRAALLVQGGFGPGRAEELIARVPQLAAVWHAAASGTRAESCWLGTRT